MILNECEFYNTRGQKIEMMPIAEFLFYYPDYGLRLADVIGYWMKSPDQICASRIQRNCKVRYAVAEAMMEALLCSRIAVCLHEPYRTEFCLDEDEAQRFSAFIMDAVENHIPKENEVLTRRTMRGDIDFLDMLEQEERQSESENFLITMGCLRYYKGEDTTIKVPEGVKIINRFAFARNESIKNVVLPMGLSVIDQSAFKGCTGLEYVSLPHTLKRLGSTAFQNCTSLREITIPDSVERVYDGAFAGCSALRNIRISENLYYLPAHIFFGCKSIESVRIPDFMSIIGFQAFGECDSLRTAYVPKQTEIDDGAFPEHTEIIRI